MHHGIINVDGFQLRYRTEGTGTPILVVGSAVYYPQLFSEEIKEKFKFIFIDHRGHVRPPGELKPTDYTLDRILRDIERIRETLQLEGFFILGHSGNAFLALAYAIKYPTHVRKVILLNTAPTNSQARQEQSIAFFNQTASSERKRYFEEEIALLAEDIAQEPERRFAHMCIRMGAHSFYDYRFDAAYMWDGVVTSMQVIDHLWGEVFAELDMREMLTRCEQPVFLGLGEYDYLVGPSTLWDQIEEKCNHVTKMLFKHSGHNLMFEEPHSFDQQIIKWMWR